MSRSGVAVMTAEAVSASAATCARALRQVAQQRKGRRVYGVAVTVGAGVVMARVSVRATPRRRIEEMQMTGRQRNLQRVARRGPMRVRQTHRHIVLTPSTVREIVRAEQFARVNDECGMCCVRLIRAHMLGANAERPV